MLLKTIEECYGAMEKTSRVILRVGLAVIGLMYFAVILLLLRYESCFPDLDTAMCSVAVWLESAKEISGAVMVPVLLYETLGKAIIARGR